MKTSKLEYVNNQWYKRLKWKIQNVWYFIVEFNLSGWIVWIFRGKPMIQYSGYHCGCCGTWHAEPFEIPEYSSAGSWWDGWGVCKGECRG